ncbi:MAG: DUF2185 domain-containing protein [Oscillospiraceae bacterium]|jgi:hypothetical protein|nr:DUF2185 domain-containing protein [Oscillospiraceae bacterium]
MQATSQKFVYGEAALATVEEAMERQFGPAANVFHELISPDIHVDLCVIPPGPGRAYVTFITLGMGARPMRLPPELQETCPSRAELVMMLPAGWDLQSREERWYWPQRWLKILARLPLEEDSWLGWGHSVPAGEPFEENTTFSGLLLLDAYQPGGSAAADVLLPGGEAVRFYQLFPLYEEELAFKIQFGTQALLRRLGERTTPVLDLTRENVCAPPGAVAEDAFPDAAPDGAAGKRLRHRIRPLLRDWEGAAGCLATDRIIADGAPVGYCYREAPDGDWDSGWRFTAGDESEDYMARPGNCGVYPLNTLVNYDAEILPLLEIPPPCAFLRRKNGFEKLERMRGRDSLREN